MISYHKRKLSILCFDQKFQCSSSTETYARSISVFKKSKFSNILNNNKCIKNYLPKDSFDNFTCCKTFETEKQPPFDSAYVAYKVI